MTPYSAIEVLRPSSLNEALRWLAQAAEGGEPLRPMAGCTDIMVEANYGRLQWQRFVDLWCLRGELSGLRWQPSGTGASLLVGALTTYSELLADPMAQARLPTLCLASSQVGATQIQARGTFAGNVENGSPAADAVPVLMALDAKVHLQGVNGRRSVPLDRYYSGYRQTGRTADELIVAISIPAQPDCSHFFRKVGTRAYQAITKVGLATRLQWRDGAIEQARVVAIAMGPTICRCPALERALVGMTGLDDPNRRALRDAQALDLTPISDVRSTAAYRAEVFARLLCQAVTEASPGVAG